MKLHIFGCTAVVTFPDGRVFWHAYNIDRRARDYATQLLKNPMREQHITDNWRPGFPSHVDPTKGTEIRGPIPKERRPRRLVIGRHY